MRVRGSANDRGSDQNVPRPDSAGFLVLIVLVAIVGIAWVTAFRQLGGLFAD